jgi:hypothetical protein
MKLPQINRHMVGVSALALTILALGAFANMSFKRPAESLAQMTSPQIEQSASVKESDLTALLSQLKEIPKNAFGYAQPGRQSENTLADNNQSAASEARNWNEEEWRLASAAVAAYRKGGEKALSAAASSNMVWQPPEEIANQKSPASR